MKRFQGWCSLCLALTILLGCGESPTPVQPQNEAKAEEQPSPDPDQSSPSPIQLYDRQVSMGDIFIAEGALSYNGYDISIQNRTVKYEGVTGPTRLSYVVVKKGNKVVADFDRLRDSLGSSTEFGLFSFLGGEPKQLVVEQLLNRVWAYWIVRLSPDFQTIFDSTKYNVGHELLVFDIDMDGIHEISMTHHAFWFFDRLCGACSPFNRIFFKYDEQAEEYLPANHVLSDYVLMDIKEYIERVEKAKQPSKKDAYSVGIDILSAVLRVVLEYVYAGKEDEAWAFYDREYTLPDKEYMRAEIKKALKEDSIYRFIYRRR